MIEKRETFHKALVGTPQYIDSEVAVCDCEEDPSNFFLVVGVDNDNNLELEVDVDSFEPLIY